MNSKRMFGTLVVAAGLAATPAAVAQRALVFDGAAIDNIGEAGAVGAGYIPVVVTTVADFQSRIGLGPWSAVVVDVTSLDGALDSIAPGLQTYMDRGGRLQMNYWNLDANPALQAIMDVASETDITVPRAYFPTSVRHPSWGTVPNIGAGMDRWADQGGVMTAATGGRVWGEFDSTGSGDGALVIGNGGRTIMNGHDWDSLSTAGTRRQDLAAAQLRWMRDKGTCAWTPFVFGATGSIAGPFTIKITEDRPLLKVTDAFLDGDRFEVFIDGVLRFTTSTPTDAGLSLLGYDEAYATGVGDIPGPGGGSWSACATELPPGTYSMTIRVIQSAAGTSSGGAAYQVCSGPAPTACGGDCVIDFYGDPDGYGAPSGEADRDYALWQTEFGGVFFTDYREPNDLALWPITDRWDSPVNPRWTHNYTPPAGLSSATLRLAIAGFADIGPIDLLVDGALLRTFDFPGAFQHTHVLEVPVPLARIDGSTTFTLASGGGDGYAIDYAALEMCGGCYADCDMSGTLDFFDFLCFQNAFAAGTAYADCDGSGTRDFFDFLCFQNEFAAGCP